MKHPNSRIVLPVPEEAQSSGVREPLDIISGAIAPGLRHRALSLARNLKRKSQAESQSWRPKTTEKTYSTL